MTRRTRILGILTQPMKALAELNREDLTVMSDLMKAGKVTPVIDRRYPLSKVPEAIRYLEDGHARGKVVITLEST